MRTVRPVGAEAPEASEADRSSRSPGQRGPGRGVVGGATPHLEDVAVKVYDVLDMTHPDTVVGRHGVWLPKRRIKVPFQWGGKIQKYQHPHEAAYPLALLGEEVAIMRALAAEKMATPINQWVYFKTVISEHLGGWWAGMTLTA